MVFRAAAILALALSLLPRRAEASGSAPSSGSASSSGTGAGWLVSIALGFALHGLWLDVIPGSRLGFVLVLVPATLALRALASRSIETASGAPIEGLGKPEKLGLALIGLGAALSFEPLAHEVRLFTMGTRADDALVGSVFLVLIAVGALAFGPLALRMGRERTRFSVLAATAVASSLMGLLFLTTLSQDGLHSYLRRFDPLLGGLRALDAMLGGALGVSGIPSLDGASIGTLWTTSILCGASLVGPCFLLGACLGSTRHLGRLAYALVGTALGLVLLPYLIRARGRPIGFDELGQVAGTWEFTVAGASAAALGLVLATFGGGARRAVPLVLGGVVAGIPWLAPGLILWSFSPWSPMPVQPLMTLSSAEGLVTVERARDGTRILTLDRKRMTPIFEEEGDDGQRIRLSWGLLPQERSGPVRGLFIGQITPSRASVLRGLGALELDRTAPWSAAMPQIEALLFAGDQPPPGQIVSCAQARTRLEAGEYDWVMATSFHGPIVTWRSESREVWGCGEVPRQTSLELPQDTVGVAWLGANSFAPRGAAFDPLFLEMNLLETFSMALVRGGAGDPIFTGPSFRVVSHPGPSPYALLRTMPQQRQFHLESAWAAGLECESAPGLARGLALHFRAQKLSSPYETRAQQIEVDEDSLRALFQAVPGPGRLDRLTREIWEIFAELFIEKRLPEQAQVYLEPIAERFAPWPALDRAVAAGYREVLEYERALQLLERARAARPEDVQLLVESARCAEEMGDDPQAAAYLEQAVAMRPGNGDLERLLGISLMRLGDPRGRELLERLLAADPDDEGLQRALRAEDEASLEGN